MVCARLHYRHHRLSLPWQAHTSPTQAEEYASKAVCPYIPEEGTSVAGSVTDVSQVSCGQLEKTEASERRRIRPRRHLVGPVLSATARWLQERKHEHALGARGTQRPTEASLCR